MRKFIRLIGDRMSMDEVDTLLQGLEDASGKVHYEGKFNIDLSIYRFMYKVFYFKGIYNLRNLISLNIGGIVY